jgi:hypothetical protein
MKGRIKTECNSLVQNMWNFMALKEAALTIFKATGSLQAPFLSLCPCLYFLLHLFCYNEDGGRRFLRGWLSIRRLTPIGTAVKI